jgi:hypothetical protein
VPGSHHDRLALRSGCRLGPDDGKPTVGGQVVSPTWQDLGLTPHAIRSAIGAARLFT